MTGTVAGITSFLGSIHIKVPNEWVEACIDWLKDEHQNSGDHLSLDKMKKLVYEQWLVADLTELGMHYFPAEVATAEKYTLSGHYCLQVNSMIDISMSYYSQQVKLKGIDTSNSSISYDEPKKPTWQPPHTRMFKLELTDGMTKIHAMEYNTIPDLNLELKPGFKVLIQGNVLCRKGILMLKKENIQVLGGEVDSLMETNTTQRILTKAMEDSAAYAGESMRYEFTAADATQYASRINTTFVKKGKDLPGTHNTKTITSGNSSKFAQRKNTSWDSKSSSCKTESWKPKLNSCADTSVQSNTGVDDFDDEWAVDDLEDEFLDDALMAATQQSSSPTFTEDSGNNFGQPDQQQQNKKRSFSPYEVNDSSMLPKKKNSRLSPRNNNERLSQSSRFDDDIFVENWDDEEMEIAIAMDVNLNKNFGSSISAKKSSSADCIVPKKLFISDNEDCSDAIASSSSSRSCQLSGSLVRTSSQPDQSINLDKDTQLKSDSITINSSTDDLMKKWLKLCKKKVENPNAYFHLMKVEPHRLPFTYLFVLQGCQLPENSSKFRIKAYVSTLLGKLERTNNKWKLMCTLNDGTGTLPVQLSDEVLTQLIGYTVQQSIKMTSAGTDPNLKKKLQEGVKQCQLKIVNLNNIFEIETNKNYSHPLVTKITSINAGHIQQLRRQVTSALAKV